MERFRHNSGKMDPWTSRVNSGFKIATFLVWNGDAWNILFWGWIKVSLWQCCSTFFLSKVLTKKEFKKISLDYPGMSKSTPSHILSSETTQWEWILPTNPNYPPHITIKFRSHWANQKPYDHMITVCRANLLANLIGVFLFYFQSLLCNWVCGL